MNIKKYLVIIFTIFLIALLTRGITKQESVEDSDNNIFIRNNNDRVYNNCMEFIADSGMNYVDDETFLMIKAAHEKIDFHGIFEIGNLQSYDFYIEKFKKLINNEVKFDVRDSKDAYYLNEYNELDNYEPDKYEYLFFDMDADGVPELCISDIEFIYVFKYIPDNNHYILWADMGSSNYRIIGSQKTTWEWFGTRIVHCFYKLDRDGNEEYTVTYMMMKPNENYIYMASLPKYETVSEKMKKQGYYASKEECYYFRITENQYNELSENYFKATNFLELKENVEKVSYTYEELWGS